MNKFKGAVGLAEMYCDKNEKRRKNNIEKYLKNLVYYATMIYFQKQILDEIKERKNNE